MASGVTANDALRNLAEYNPEKIVKQTLITCYEKIRNVYEQFYEQNKNRLAIQKQQDLDPNKLMSCGRFTALIDKAMCFGAIVHYNDQVVRIRRCYESFDA